MKRICLSLVILMISCTKQNEEQLAKHLVQLLVTKQTPDFQSPWQEKDPQIERHTAVRIPGGSFLTTAFAIHHAAQVEASLIGNAERHAMKIEHIDYEANLALVAPVGKAPFASVQTISLGSPLSKGSTATILSARDGDSWRSYPGRTSQISLKSSVLGPYRLVTCELEVGNAKSLGWSEPVFYDGKLVGISTGTSGDFLTVIAADMIAAFISDINDPPYRGFPAMGIVVRSEPSPTYRSAHKVPANVGGVLVTEVFANSPFVDQIKPGDFLVEIAGKPIDKLGLIAYEGEQKIEFTYAIAQARSGDELEVLVYRSGEALTFKKKLTRFDSNKLPIPHFLAERYVDHLVFGGLVLQELSLGMLKMWGDKWQQKSPLEFMKLWRFDNEPSGQVNKRFVVLNRVLADAYNRGYQNLKYGVVKQVNNKPVHSLKQVRDVLLNHPIQKGGQSYAKFNLDLDGGEMILSLDGLDAANLRMKKNYALPASSLFSITQK